MIGLAGTPAFAHSRPSLGQIQHEYASDLKRADGLDQQYDALRAQSQSGRATADATQHRVQIQSAVAGQEQRQVAGIAAELYENKVLTSPAALSVERDPQRVLDQVSVLQELDANDVIALRRYGQEKAELARLRAQERRQDQAVASLGGQARHVHDELLALSGQMNALEGSSPQTGGRVAYTGPTQGQANQAVLFAYDQLGCPYVFGGIGPCHSGFDCSGLVMQAWAYAGISIPRTSEEQWASLPKVPVSELQPGDLLIFLDGDHVGMYVGHGMLIEAPHTGAFVQLAPFTGWYRDNFVAAVRP